MSGIMKPNPNKIIRAVALMTAACALLCACDKTKPTEQETTTESTSQNTTVTQTQPVTEEPTTAPVTQESTTQKPTTTKPVSTAPQPTKPTTTQPESTETTKAPSETTTRHESDFVNAIITADKIVSYRLISKDEINQIATEMADDSEIYYARLQDGTKTYYMAVDLQTAQALALSNPQVLRELCRQLDAKQQLMANKDKDYVLMDYTHLVGELEVHYLGYLLTGALGADSGPLSSFYRSCKVADLNIDESRFGPIIDIIGTIYG
ncbi:MAG: hypothetical protein IJ261_04200 [Clostridia bacterium]|nr:hypothetical protein [Clostridia bacterium]